MRLPEGADGEALHNEANETPNETDEIKTADGHESPAEALAGKKSPIEEQDGELDGG